MTALAVLANAALLSWSDVTTLRRMISANIDGGEHGDDYFELMMRNVWHVSGGEGWCANTTCKRVLVVFEDDRQQVVEVTDDFDVDTKDLAAVKAKLTEQGITVSEGSTTFLFTADTVVPVAMTDLPTRYRCLCQ